MDSNVHKSDAGWIRFRARTNSGQRARRAVMEARPTVAKTRRERLEQIAARRNLLGRP